MGNIDRPGRPAPGHNPRGGTVSPDYRPESKVRSKMEFIFTPWLMWRITAYGTLRWILEELRMAINDKAERAWQDMFNEAMKESK